MIYVLIALLDITLSILVNMGLDYHCENVGTKTRRDPPSEA